MQFNLYFQSAFANHTRADRSARGIIWLFQTIRILELVVNRGAAVGDFC